MAFYYQEGSDKTLTSKPGWFTFPTVFQCSHSMRNNTQWHSQGLPGWASRPPGRSKWGRKLRKFEEKWEKLKENEERLRKFLVLPTQEWEAGYGPDLILHLLRGIVKSSRQVCIQKYLYFKQSTWLYSGKFVVVLFLKTIFQAFRTWKDILQNSM